MWIKFSPRVHNSTKNFENLIANIIENQAAWLMLSFFIKEVLPEVRIVTSNTH